jgi:hypothetical protein
MSTAATDQKTTHVFTMTWLPAVRSEKTKHYLAKDQVAMYISKCIYIECITLFKYSKAVPFLGYDWPKSRDQMYTTNNEVNGNNACTPLSIHHQSTYPVHSVFGISRCWDISKPLNICKVFWRRRIQDLGNNSTWNLEHNPNLGNSVS